MSLKNLNSIQENNVIEEENVIIGSGAGGSTIAYELLKQGKNSLILEEGPNINDLDFSNIGKNIINLYKNNGATPMMSSNKGPLIGYGQGSCVGGSTYVNAGYYSNTPEWIYDNWIKEERTILDYKEFQRFLNEIRSELKINTENLTKKDGDSKYLFEKSKKLDWKIDKCERFSSAILGQEKQNMNETYHKKILKENMDIIYNCKIEKININNRQAKSIVAINKINKKKYFFKFKNLFINCGPISTPHLLLKNNLIRFNNFNRNFEFHINFKIIVKFKNEINFNSSKKFDPNSPVSIYFLREFEKEGALLSSANSELPYLLATSSHFNEDIKKDIFMNFSHYAMYIYQIKSNSLGKIKSIFNNPYVEYEYDHRDNEEIKKAIKRTSKFFIGRDVDFMLYPFENSKPINNIQEATYLSENFNYKKLHLVSVHGMSSMRSSKYENSLTDYYGKLKGYQNIYINDASILPGNTGESPQASIMAFAKFVAKNLPNN
tara:strand:+ start:937 stop:2412 length:1476 start_codon:yes stop_codon:yes gene_type:complete